MEEKHLVSVMIPTYNRERLLVRAINSVLKQTYQNFELIVVDDCSTDNTEQIVKAFNDKRIIYHKHATNRGVLAAKNTGFDLARGEFLCRLDDDDELLPEALESGINKLTELLPQGIKGIWFNTADAETGEIIGYGKRDEGILVYEDYLCGKIRGDFWGFMHKDFIGSGRFDESMYPLESILWFKLHRESKGYYIPKILYRVYREKGRDRVSNFEHILLNLTKLQVTQRAFLVEYGEDMKNICPKQYGKRLANKGFFDLLSGNEVEARKALAASFKYSLSARYYASYLLSYFLNNRQIIALIKIYISLQKLIKSIVSPIVRSDKILSLI